MTALGKTLLFKLDKKYDIDLLRCLKVSPHLLSFLIFFLLEIITVTCLLLIFLDTHIHTLLLPFSCLFVFLSVPQSKAFYVHCSVACSFHFVCLGNLSVLVPIILLHYFWHLLNIRMCGDDNIYLNNSLLLGM